MDDYRDIDPVIGTLGEFDDVVRELHARGIKVIVDIVPNHSSDRHERFRAALAAGPGSAERERYHFRDGRGENGEEPPSDWQSFLGGSAWERVPDGQWYLHLFTPQQPDWNWANPEVRADFLRTLRFWGDRGVDGFRVDVAMTVTKDLREPLPPWSEIVTGLAAITGRAASSASSFAEGHHPLFDRDDVQTGYAEWRELFDSYDPPLFAVAEAVAEPHRRLRNASRESFDLLAAPWDAESFGKVISQELDLTASSTWVLSNHDVERHASRYAPDSARAVGLMRARAATLLTLALPGSAYLYQGEELGLPQVTDLPREVWQDPVALRSDAAIPSRDGCRVPLPWTSQAPYFGFSSSASHLPQPAWFGEYSIEAEHDDPGSTLNLYRAALRIRKSFAATEDFAWIDAGPDALAFRRDGMVSVTNFGTAPIKRPNGTVLLSSQPLPDEATLPPDTTAWLTGPGKSGGS